MKVFVCTVCGHIAFDTIPENCPVCGAPKEKFKEDSNAIKKPGDPSNKYEAEQKHIPAVTVKKKCGLLGAGCTDVHVKIGEVIHPMEEKHFIRHIDFYLDNKFIARKILSPVVLNPASCVHLKVNKGKIKVIQNCNLHGNWMAEADL
jgi:superoxide reductase